MRARQLLLAAAVTLVIVATVLAVSGGFRTTVGGFRLSARSPLAASIAACVAAGAWFVLARKRGSIAADLESAWHTLENHSTRVVGTIALIAAIVAATFATRSAAGADASGYLSAAEMFTRGEWFYFEPLAASFTDFDGRWTTPLGWRPLADAALQAPTYPPGLPLLMAIPHAVAGIDGATAVVTASAALAVWATGMIAGGAAGIIAAAFLACSPTFLYQSIQPMSDVPVTAAWMMCFLLLVHDRRAVWAGMACAIAIMIRPNLAPLAIVPFFVVRQKWRFAIPAIAGGVFVAVLQLIWYGSPLRSGYGTAPELFSIANVFPNAGRYATWLFTTSPVLFLAPLGYLRVRRQPHARALMIFTLLVVASYLIYAVFDHWSYLRFLLPALAVLAIFAAIALNGWIATRPVAARFPILVVLTLGVAAHGLFVARSSDTFRLPDQLRRVEQVAMVIGHTAPPDAVIIAGEQSGSMRYYTSRSILRWDAASPESFPPAVETLLEARRPIYIVLDAWEMEPYRAKFPNVGPAELDWPPMLEAGSSHRTLAWNLADRWRYQLGQRINTIRIP